jgi:hypothetical protein
MGLLPCIDVEHPLALTQACDFGWRQSIETSLGLQEIFGAERRPHESPRLVIAHGQQDMTHFVGEDPSQRAPYVLRTEARATQQASELPDTRGAEEFLGRLMVDMDRQMVNASQRQVRAPQDQLE